MSILLTDLDKLKLWYENQKASAYLQIAVTEVFNDTSKKIDIEESLNEIKNKYESIITDATIKSQTKYKKLFENLKKVEDLIPKVNNGADAVILTNPASEVAVPSAVPVATATASAETVDGKKISPKGGKVKRRR